MAGIIDYISQIRNKFQFLKWIQIIPQESLATKKSALYFVEKSPTTAEAIIVDDLGQKRKLVDSKYPTPPSTGTYTLQSIDGVLTWI